jgi:negative regulator of sigma E activity
MQKLVSTAICELRLAEYFMSANEHIEELLSGFLDGELTAEEMREFQLALSADASLQAKLEQLRQLGNDLRSVPKPKLGADFTERVVAAAREAAMQSSVSQPVQPASKLADHKLADHKLPDTLQANRWKTIGASVAFAAALLLAIFAFNEFGTVTGPSNEDVAQNPPTEVPANEVAAATEKRATENTATENTATENTATENTATENTVNKEEAFVRNDPNMRKRASSQTGFSILTIMEIEPSEKAWRENEVSKVLKEAGIVWTNPVKVSDDILGVLNETRSISQGLPKADNEQLALVMVMAKGLTMDRALKRILDGVDVFPHVTMDLAFDVPGKELCQKLVDAQITVANGQQAIATPIVAGAVADRPANSGLESFTQFSSAPPARYMATDVRQSGQLGTAILPDEEDAMSYVLLVIRQPAKLLHRF